MPLIRNPVERNSSSDVAICIWHLAKPPEQREPCTPEQRRCQRKRSRRLEERMEQWQVEGQSQQLWEEWGRVQWVPCGRPSVVFPLLQAIQRPTWTGDRCYQASSVFYLYIQGTTSLSNLSVCLVPAAYSRSNPPPLEVTGVAPWAIGRVVELPSPSPPPPAPTARQDGPPAISK